MVVKISKILEHKTANRFKMMSKIKRNQQIRKARNRLFRPANALDNYIDGRKNVNPSSFRAKQWRLYSLKTPISYNQPLVTAQFAR